MADSGPYYNEENLYRCEGSPIYLLWLSFMPDLGG